MYLKNWPLLQAGFAWCISSAATKNNYMFLPSLVGCRNQKGDEGQNVLFVKVKSMLSIFSGIVALFVHHVVKLFTLAFCRTEKEKLGCLT